MFKTSNISPLTISRILFSALAVVALGVVVNAQTVVRTNGGTLTATGTDVSTVQTASGYASGDVISVTGTSSTSLAPFSTEVRSDGTSSNPYNVIDFTVQSGTSNRQYIGAPPAGKRNYVLSVGNNEYNLTFKNVEFQNNDTPQNNSGIFLLMNQDSSSVTLNLDNVSFTKYKGQIGTSSNSGGVIRSSGDLTFKGNNTVSFKGNVAYSGGAIFAGKTLTINCDEIIFDSNSTYNSGAIRNNKALTISGSKVTFSNNSASNKGGSIYTSSSVTMTGTGDNPIFTFSGNKATDQGGVIYSDTNGTGIDINCNTIKFSDNQASAGGAIAFEITNNNYKVFITGKDVTFEKNATTSGNGGAIHTQASVELKGKSDDSVFTFSKNSSKGNAGVMVVVGTVDISTGTFKFEKNSANGNTGIAGAIEARNGITFSGDNTSATFTGNIARSGNGNDIYLGKETSTTKSVLTFKDNGKYSFDGGIYLVDNTLSTVINKAQVTIAGRQYKPVINEGDPANVEDHTNNYQLQNVTISNGGKLTANLDYIDSLTGIFNVGTADTAGTLELNVSGTKPVLLDAVNIVSTNNGVVKKTGDGTLQISAAEEQVKSHSFVVSAGRLDMKEYFTGSLEIGEQTGEGIYSTAIFSPGNSVGKLEVTGNFTLNPGSTLLMEIGSTDAEGNDQLIINDGGSVLFQDNSIIEFAPYSSYTPSLNDVIEVTMPDVDWENVTFSSYYFTLQGYDGTNVLLGVNPNAVPEPSTWALLALGVVVLFLRKRVRN